MYACAAFNVPENVPMKAPSKPVNTIPKIPTGKKPFIAPGNTLSKSMPPLPLSKFKLFKI